MKKAAILLIVAVAMIFAGTVTTQAATPADSISDSMLAEMGMADMQQISDQDGMEIRGAGGTYIFAMNLGIIRGNYLVHSFIVLQQSITFNF